MAIEALNNLPEHLIDHAALGVKSNTTEAAQDAVGSILTDTASIDFTYDDATPKITADVIPGGVDHNALLNTHNLTTDINHNLLTNTHNLTSDIDHGSIDGLTDDDHTQYILANGLRAFTGNQSFGDNNITNVGDISLDSITADDGTGPIVVNDDLRIIDGEKLFLGTGDDGQIYSSSDDLYIENVTANKDIIFQINDSDGGGVNTEVMRVDGSESVLAIGRTSRWAVVGSLSIKDNAEIVFDGGSAALNFVSFRDATAHGKFTPWSARGSEASPDIVGSSDVVFEINPQAYDGDSWVPAGRIRFVIDGTPGDGDMPTKLEFQTTADGADSLSTRVTIKEDGDMGVNDITPSFKLDVNGTGRFTGKLTLGGGSDPPYVLYDYESRQSTIDRVTREVPPGKLKGAVMFYNGSEDRMELFFPLTGQFKDFAGNVLETVDPITTTYDCVDKYYFDEETGEVKSMEIASTKSRTIIKEGYGFNPATGTFHNDEGVEVTQQEATRSKVHVEDIDNIEYNSSEEDV